MSARLRYLQRLMRRRQHHHDWVSVSTMVDTLYHCFECGADRREDR